MASNDEALDRLAEKLTPRLAELLGDKLVADNPGKIASRDLCDVRSSGLQRDIVALQRQVWGLYVLILAVKIIGTLLSLG